MRDSLISDISAVSIIIELMSITLAPYSQVQGAPWMKGINSQVRANPFRAFNAPRSGVLQLDFCSAMCHLMGHWIFLHPWIWTIKGWIHGRPLGPTKKQHLASIREGLLNCLQIGAILALINKAFTLLNFHFSPFILAGGPTGQFLMIIIGCLVIWASKNHRHNSSSELWPPKSKLQGYLVVVID